MESGPWQKKHWHLVLTPHRKSHPNMGKIVHQKNAYMTEFNGRYCTVSYLLHSTQCDEEIKGIARLYRALGSNGLLRLTKTIEQSELEKRFFHMSDKTSVRNV